ncbi:MAG: hypothetical protein HKM23_07580 [Nitrosopumilus sp.]|nr:hypothetical protein [Nitrosopumilus sp.]NNL59130.1 hypothetical protein [Nitrosopumilus sp.]
MPHIVIGKTLDLFDFSKKFIPIFQKSPLIKIQTIFVEKNGFTALLPTIVIDESHKEFFIELSTTKEKTTIRLHPLTDPEKTDSVKLSLAKLYSHIKSVYPDISITKTNLSDYVERVE